MKAIVTGGAGFIGTNLIKQLLSNGEDVVSLDNYSTGLMDNEQEGCEYHDIDITNDKILTEILNDEKPDVNVDSFEPRLITQKPFAGMD